jgi:hypothetical protein
MSDLHLCEGETILGTNLLDQRSPQQHAVL